MNFPLKTVLAIGLILFFVFSPYDFEARVSKRREKYTSRLDTPLEFAIVWPKHNSGLFVEGAMLAVEEINSRGGVLIANSKGVTNSVPLKAHVFEEGSGSSFSATVEKIAANHKLSAVLGHHRPEFAIRASVNYDETGLLFIAPVVSDPQLTLHGFRMTVQSVPDDRLISSALVRFAADRGWKKPAILYVRNTYGNEFSGLISEHIEGFAVARDQGEKAPEMEVAYKGFYGEDSRSFYLLISDLLDHPFDSLFVIDSLVGDAAPRTMTLIEQLRRMGVTQPIIGSDELHSRRLADELGSVATNIFAGALIDFQSTNASPRAREFKKNFSARYKVPATITAAQAYEAVYLLIQAAQRARSTVPIQMATMFKSTDAWHGLEGDHQYSFTLNGSIAGKKVYIEGLREGEFHPEILTGTYSFSRNGAIAGKQVYVEELRNGVFVPPSLRNTKAALRN